MGMVEVGDHTCFGQISLRILRPRHHCGMGHLDRHRTLEFFVVGQVHPSEGAAAANFLDAVAANPVRQFIRGRRLKSFLEHPLDVVGAFRKAGTVHANVRKPVTRHSSLKLNGEKLTK